MAVITISRQVAALGDEVAAALAERLGYKFINRKIVEKKLIDLGFSEAKLTLPIGISVYDSINALKI